MSEHRWVHNSGTTNICADCGCVAYERLSSRGVRAGTDYSQWKPRKREWSDWAGSRKTRPNCEPDRAHEVPDWVKVQHPRR